MRLPIAAVLIGSLALAGPAGAASDELSPEQDNGAENSCGTPCVPSDDPPPKVACDNVRSAAGSLVERRLPKGPVHRDGSLAFRSGICVYLPPGYESGQLRYPVIYLLHGGGGDQGDWISQGDAQQVLDDAYVADPVSAAIVVTPDGTPDASWFDRLDGSTRNQEYVLDYLIPFVDRHYRTITDRRGRAIAGLSNGGHGTLYLSATAPHLFEAAGGMSSNVGWQSFTGGAELNSSDAPAWFNGHLPIRLAGNLDGLDLILDIGASCESDVTTDLCGTFAFEQVFLQDNRDFVAELRRVRHIGVHDYRETEGGHAWRWWSKWLRERDLPFLLRRLANPQPAGDPVEPSPPRLPFRYRSVLDSFSVYGYDVTVHRKARELLELRDVDAGGLTAQGSGAADVVTAPLYRAGSRYLVTGEGAGARLASAGQDRRLRLRLDLGPPHELEQFSEEQQERERAGGYWTVRRVGIDALTSRCGDRSAPRARLHRWRIGNRGVRLRGRASDGGCAGLRNVLVSVARVQRGRCRFLRPDGRLGSRSSCRSRRYLRASGRTEWSLRRRARLPRGRYRVWVRAVDGAGNASRTRRPLRVRLP